MDKKNVLTIGGGGREHAICLALKRSNRVGKLYCIPGNAGIAEIAECRPDIKAGDLDGILAFVRAHKDIYMTVVAPDDPLSAGLVDALLTENFRAFGPVRAAARIESSKAFSKELMNKYGIPTAAYETFTDLDKALKHVEAREFPLVIKADGLALGKGVVIARDLSGAQNALKDMMKDAKFGAAGKTVVIEEFLEGFETSVLAFTDGKTIVPMPPSQDHKRALDGDKGDNTGGMGAFAPSPRFTAAHAEKAYKTVISPTLNALSAEGITFKGVLYFGLMVSGGDIKVLEYNARFGDPEAQAVLPLLTTDLLDIFDAVIDGRLDKIKIEWSGKTALCVVAASGGYPGKYATGYEITATGIEPDVTLYYAGAAEKGGKKITCGGRVLGVGAVADGLDAARKKVYRNIEKIRFKDMYYRKDI